MWCRHVLELIFKSQMLCEWRHHISCAIGSNGSQVLFGLVADESCNLYSFQSIYSIIYDGTKVMGMGTLMWGWGGSGWCGGLEGIGIFHIACKCIHSNLTDCQDIHTFLERQEGNSHYEIIYQHITLSNGFPPPISAHLYPKLSFDSDLRLE